MSMSFKQFLIEGTVNFNDKSEWVAAMKDAGVTEFLNEKEFNTTLIYAVAKDMLKGTWNPNKKTGIMYQGPKGAGMKFYKGKGKTRRSFKKADLNESILEEKVFDDEFDARDDAIAKAKRSGHKIIVIRKGKENKFMSIPFDMYDHWSRKEKSEWKRI